MLRFIALALVAVTLTACGGGDPDDERVDIGPVHCEQRPELCK